MNDEQVEPQDLHTISEKLGDVGKAIGGITAITGLTFAAITFASEHIPILTLKEAVSIVVAILAGLLAQLLKNYQAQCGLAKAVIRVEQQLHFNGNSSLKDWMARRFNDVEGQFRLLLTSHDEMWDTLQVAGYRTDCDGQCVAANKSLCELFGIPRAEMMGTGWLSAIASQSDREQVWAAWQESQNQHIPYLQRYKVRNRKTGEIFTVESGARASYNPKTGTLDGHVGSIHRVDVDESRRETD